MSEKLEDMKDGEYERRGLLKEGADKINDEINEDLREKIVDVMFPEQKDEDPEEEVILAEAIVKAKQAFINYLSEEYNYDPAYFRLKIVVEHLDVNFEEVLARTTYEEVG